MSILAVFMDYWCHFDFCFFTKMYNPASDSTVCLDKPPIKKWNVHKNAPLSDFILLSKVHLNGLYRFCSHNSRYALMMLSPTVPDFSGWNCVPSTLPFCAAAQTLRPPYIVSASRYVSAAGFAS